MLKESLNTILKLIVLIVIINSCASRRSTINSSSNDKYRSNLTSIDNTNYQLLNGIYENSNASTSFSFWEKSILKIDLNSQTSYSTDTIVIIKFLSKKKLRLSLIANDKVIYEKRFKGRIISGLFVFNRQIKIQGIPPLFWQYGDQITAIGLYKNKDLIVFVNVAGAFLITIAPMMPSPNSDLRGPSIYERINNN